jgi:hypothetical protein
MGYAYTQEVVDAKSRCKKKLAAVAKVLNTNSSSRTQDIPKWGHVLAAVRRVPPADCQIGNLGVAAAHSAPHPHTAWGGDGGGGAGSGASGPGLYVAPQTPVQNQELCPSRPGLTATARRRLPLY